MKKLIFLLGLSLCGLVASAQPTSFGGITPGKTTLEELKGLVNKSGSFNVSSGPLDRRDVLSVNMKQPKDQHAFVRSQDGVVYEVEVLIPSEEVQEALIAKYGQPKIKVGGIRTVNCQNKFGATFQRYQGQENRLWPVKDGVQGRIEYFASECAEYMVVKKYVLEHVATVAAMEEKREEEARKEARKAAEKQRSKFDGAL